MAIPEHDYTETYLRQAKSALAVIATYPKRRRLPPPPTGEEPAWPRGVYEMEVAPRGYKAFNVVYSNGDIAFHQFPEHRATRTLVQGLQRALDRDDPITLTLISAGHPSSSPHR